MPPNSSFDNIAIGAYKNTHENTGIREKIIALVAKYPRYPHDLYAACTRDTRLSRSEFRQLLDEMDRDSEIRINANSLVQLPKPSETKPSPAEKINGTAELPEKQVENFTNEILIHCLVNRSVTLKHPKQKKPLENNYYYAHRNYTTEQIPLNRVCEEALLNGFQFVPGEFRPNPDPNIGIRTAENWHSQQLFLIEFDNTTENTLTEFIAAHPFVKEHAWFLTESIRSRYNDPDDDTCNGQLRPRIAFCMPLSVTSLEERKWVYKALVKELPSCDDGSANSITNGGLGNASAEHIKIGKIVDTGWFNRAIATGQQKKAEADKAKQERAEASKRKQAERAAMGFTDREGELPLEALAKSDPSLFLDSLGLSLKSESGQYQHWGRPEKQGDTALSVWQSDHGNWQIRVFANSISTPPSVSGAMPFTRFYCYHELNTDIDGLQPDTPQWKDINAQLAGRGYGTWLSDDAFRKKHATPTQTPRNSNESGSLQALTTLPPDHPILTSAPPVEVRETPSFRHFSKEERAIVSSVLSLNPDAGWQGQTPIFTTRYEYLHPLTQKFALNGQPSEVEKRRVWSTLFGNCEICGAVTAEWVDRYLLTAGRYCDGCHKDYALGSYLELELNRKLPNSIISEHQGFLGDDPEFRDFRLWEPGMMTHLGAGMATGKSTEIYKAMIALALQGLGKGIIAVPRVSLARFLAHNLRGKYGYRSWGLWYEGCHKAEKFIGDFGAIVCLPSLPVAVATAEHDGVSQLYIAIDEVDFGYNLLSLSVEQATAVKKCLRDALASTGLLVSGQTESTLALEGLAEELGCEQIQGFYNTAKPADGCVVMHKHANIDGKSISILCGGIDDISDALKTGHNVYAFSSTRRDGDVLADEFKNENPVIYNAYTKGNSRADAVLRNQKLTDSRLFIGTSAAGVGISILDPNARTVILNGLNYGSRDASMSVQECVRDRWRCGISYHYADYDLSLPVRPSENEKVSIYHEALKAAALREAHLSAAGIRKIAHAQALTSLADTQIETFIEYHLGIVGNMPVHHASALESEPDRITSISTRRAEIRREERQKRITTAIELLNVPALLTTSEIRVLSNQGGLSPDERLAHETANAAAQAVGWDNEIHGYVNGIPIRILPNPDDLKIAIELTEQNINTDKLSKQRRGYLAVNFPQWTAHQFQSELERSDSELVTDGLGIEITAIDDDRFIGELLSALLERLVGKMLDSASLAEAVRVVLASDASTGKTFSNELVSGALGASAYRKARFLHIADDDRVVDWVRALLSEWYPARIAKNEDTYALCHAENLEVRLTSFSRWLMHQPSVPDGTQIDLDIFQPIELPDPNAELKKVARFRREAGETIKVIAESLSLHPNTVSKWCKGITPASPVQSDVLGILSDGKVWKMSDIVAHSRFARQNVWTALKKLLDVDKIGKIKRGFYQIKK